MSNVISIEMPEVKKRKNLIISNENKISIKPLNQFKPLEFVCKKLKLIKGNLVSVVAAGGSGKSLFLQHFALCVATGSKLLGVFDVEQGNVLHIDLEQSERLTNSRYTRMANGLKIAEINNITRISFNRINKSCDMNELENELIELFKNYTVIIIDSLKKISDADENHPEIEPIINLLRHAAEKANTLIMMIHHMGKATGNARQSGRGHSSIYDSVDMQIDLEHEANDNTGTVELHCVKNREGATFPGIKFRFFDQGETNIGQDCSNELCFECLDACVSFKEKENKEIDLKIKILENLKGGEINLSSLFSLIKGDRNFYEKMIKSCLENKLINERIGQKNSRIFSITSEGISFLNYNKEIE